MSDAVTFESFEAELRRLVELFERNLATFKGPQYDEASLRQEFLNPLLRAPGWNPERALARPPLRYLRPAAVPVRPVRRVPRRGRSLPGHPRVQESDERAGPFRLEEWPVLA
jgi:hypothetical protein